MLSSRTTQDYNDYALFTSPIMNLMIDDEMNSKSDSSNLKSSSSPSETRRRNIGQDSESRELSIFQSPDQLLSDLLGTQSKRLSAKKRLLK